MLKTTLQHGDAILQRLPTGFVTGAEIGVGRGELSAYLLTNRPSLRLLMVDSFAYAAPHHPYRRHAEAVGDPYGERRPHEVRADRDAALAVEQRFNASCAPGHPQVIMIALPSMEAVKKVPDATLDFVFIDADHRYETTLADCRVWVTKVKPGGWIGGHDIDRFRDGGVRRAVDQFAAESHLTIATGDNWTWFCRVPFSARGAKP